MPLKSICYFIITFAVTFLKPDCLYDRQNALAMINALDYYVKITWKSDSSIRFTSFLFNILTLSSYIYGKKI
jgi:hypothetical protein